MLNRTHVYLEITPTRLELAVCSGTSVTQSRVERYSPPEAATDLAEVLRPRHATLAGWARELGLAGAPTTIVFSTPTTTCSIVSIPSAIASGAAAQATRLALADLAGYPADENPSDTQHQLTDIAAWARAGSAAGNPMSHSLAAVEQESTCQLLAQWVASCGLSVQRMVPVNAGPIASCLRQISALGNNPQAPARAILWLGEHDSFLMVGGPTGLALFRPLGLGVESLVEATQRPIQPRTPGAASVTIDRAAARSIVERCGIPQPTDLIDPRNDLAGSGLIPLLSPVLQRCAVEIKQSLRFGLAEQDRAGLTVTLAGPGASVQRLAEVLSGLSQSPVVATPAQGDNTSAARGNIAALLASPHLELSILPAQMLSDQLTIGARRSLRVGLAAATLLAGAYAGWSWLALQSAQAQAHAIGSIASNAKATDQQRRASSAASFAAHRASEIIAESMGPGPAWAAVLASLAQSTPEHTTITSMELADTDPSAASTTGARPGPIARVGCSMRAVDDAAFATQLRAYIAALESTPGVASVKMGGTSRAGGASSPDSPVVLDVFSFDLTLNLVSLPYVYLAPEALAHTLGDPAHSSDAAGGQP